MELGLVIVIPLAVWLNADQQSLLEQMAISYCEWYQCDKVEIKVMLTETEAVIVIKQLDREVRNGLGAESRLHKLQS